MHMDRMGVHAVVGDLPDLVPTPENITKPGFADWCADRLEAAVPVHRWLVDEL